MLIICDSPADIHNNFSNILYFLGCSLVGKSIVLPDISNANLKKHLYYKISENCMRFDACVDFTLEKFNYTKALRAYIDLDPCQFLLTVAFEKWTHTLILINYNWGKFGYVYS